MKYYNINNYPGKTREVVFSSKPKATGVGFVSIGQRIRGLLTNNKLDLSGVNVSDDYDVPPDLDDKEYTKDINYDETQDYMDKLDVADKIETISSKINSNLEEQVLNKVATSKKNKESVSSIINITPPTSTDEVGTE